MTQEFLVFVSYANEDRKVADAVVGGLEHRGVRCWMAPRDIGPGQEWAEAIIDGIKRSSAMVVVFSGSANKSKQVLREVERAINHGLTVIPFRIEDIEPSGAMEYFLTVPHWLDAMTEPMERSIESLHAALAHRTNDNSGSRTGEQLQAARSNRSPLLILSVIVAVALVGIGFWWSGRGDSPPDAVENVEPPSQIEQLLNSHRDGLAASVIANTEAVLAMKNEIPNQLIDLRLWLEPDRENFVSGERFNIRVTTDTDCYFAVFVHSADGSTVLIYPNKFDDGSLLKKDQVLVLGDGSDSFDFEIQPPWGVDVIHGIASTDRESMQNLVSSATPIAGTFFRSIEREVLAAGIKTRGIAVTSSKDSGATAADDQKWGDYLYAIRTRPE